MNSFTLTIQSVFIPLILTVIIELGVWKFIVIIFKEYDIQYFWLSIIAINLLTNPAFNVLSSILDPSRTSFLLEIIYEILIILVEAVILYIIYKRDFNRFLIISAVMNMFSYGTGMLIYSPF